MKAAQDNSVDNEIESLSCPPACRALKRAASSRKFSARDIRHHAIHGGNNAGIKERGKAKQGTAAGIVSIFENMTITSLAEEKSESHHVKANDVETKLSSLKPMLETNLSSLSNEIDASPLHQKHHATKGIDADLIQGEELRRVQDLVRSKGLVTTYAAMQLMDGTDGKLNVCRLGPGETSARGRQHSTTGSRKGHSYSSRAA